MKRGRSDAVQPGTAMKPGRSGAVPPSCVDISNARRAVADARAAGNGSRINVDMVAVGFAALRSGCDLCAHGDASAWLKLGQNLSPHAGRCQLRRAHAFAASWQKAQVAAGAQLEATKLRQLDTPRSSRSVAAQTSTAWVLRDLRQSDTDAAAAAADSPSTSTDAASASSATVSTAAAAPGCCPHPEALADGLPIVWRAGAARPPTGWATPSVAGATFVRLLRPPPIRSSSREGARFALGPAGAVVGEMTGLRACDHSSTRGGSVTCKVELNAQLRRRTPDEVGRQSVARFAPSVKYVLEKPYTEIVWAAAS